MKLKIEKTKKKNFFFTGKGKTKIPSKIIVYFEVNQNFILMELFMTEHGEDLKMMALHYVLWFSYDMP